ncbi:MAG TPA: cupin domain-containing protein, partial [Sphingomonadales bacterium]|nr:cupin domain-containing protein [Sphingomonadales bacterium]
MAKGPIMNLDEVEYFNFGNQKKFQCKLGAIGKKIGAKRLGYNVTVVPPGKCAFPYHLHHTNEEMFLILEGEGQLRYNGKEYPLRKGD